MLKKKTKQRWVVEYNHQHKKLLEIINGKELKMDREYK